MMKATWDDTNSVRETQLTTVGPSLAVPPGKGGSHAPRASKDQKQHHKDNNRKQTVAWSETESQAKLDDDEKDKAHNGDNVPATKRGSKPTRQAQPKAKPTVKPIHKLALAIVLLQALWAWVIPLKNIATVTFPTIHPDISTTKTYPYLSNDAILSGFSFGPTQNQPPVAVPGTEIVPLLQQVLEIVLGDAIVRQQLMEIGTFDIAAIYKLVGLDDFAVVAKYASLVHQSTEFPGGRFTVRPFQGNTSTEPPKPKLQVFLKSSFSDEMPDVAIELSCSQEKAFLQATRCTRTRDGYPCNDDPDESVLYQDVNLENLAQGTGLENNVALLFVIDYFHQVMGTLFAAKDWAAMVDNLNFNQSIIAHALDTGSASVYKDGSPYLMDTDAFLVGIVAAAMETSLLESCIASELVIGQFYVRSFVLSLVQSALQSHGVFDPWTPEIFTPNSTEAMLEPIWKSSIHVTSGAYAQETQQSLTRFYGQTVATLTTSAAQFKLDRKETTASQVAGSSMRLLQQMVYYADVVSTFQYTTTPTYDSQQYKLLGWAGSEITGFRDSFTATSLMVLHLNELPRVSNTVADPYWDDEAQYAGYFQALEARASSSDSGSTKPTAPFKVFEQHLAIKSMTRVAPSDDEPANRCQRALFKVVGKVSYLALLELSKPAGYLMFMGELPSGAKRWLISQIFQEELVAESFSGERLPFTYRNGPYTRKDDGSAWVTILLLDAMLKFYGKDTTATALLQELDASLTLFLRAANGNLNFPDAAACRLSGAAGSPQEVSSSDSLDQIYDKILPGLQLGMLDLLEEIPSITTRFQKAMEAKGVSWVTLTKDQIIGSPVITNTTEGRGPPVADWQPTAFTAGLLKFWPPKTPTREVVAKLRASSVCYKMLDLRGLRETVRCFAEPLNAVVVRHQYRSEPMRKFFQLVWSMAVMLNTIAFFVILKYIRKLYKAYAITKFECLDVRVALQLNLQGIGVLSISQSLLVLVASLPAILTFHIPSDPTFMPFLDSERLPKPFVDVLVTLSMSWVMKLGFDLCNMWIRSKRPLDWYHLFHVRWFLLCIILILRLITPARVSESFEMLILTLILSLLFGACCMCVIFLPERRGKVVAEERKENHDAVVAALVKQNMPLTRYGVVGRTATGWSKTGLIVEGWRLGRAANGDEVLRKDGGEIVLPKVPLDDVDSVEDDDVVATEPTSEVTW